MAGTTPKIHRPFDRAAVRRHRERRAGAYDRHDFLMREIASRVADRLLDVNRRFERALGLGSRNGLAAGLVAGTGRIGTLIETDLAPAMVRTTAGPAVACDPEVLPFAPASFDLVFSVLDLHGVNDLPGVLVQIRRALRPDGLFLAALFGAGTLGELRQSLLAAELEVEAGASPRIAPFADVRDLGELLPRAGFALPVADVDTVTITYADPLRLMADLRGMGEANALSERRRAPLRRETLRRAAALYRERFGASDGRVPATFNIVYLTGWHPHESQQAPLKPGAAQHRLADALGAEERAAGDKAIPRRRR